VVTLAHANPQHIACLFTDASETNWGAILTQVPPSDLDLPFEEQRHEPLAFLSGSFKKAASRWSVLEKEAFALIESVLRLDYLLVRPNGFMLFTDARNLTFMYDPSSVLPTAPRFLLNKVERWGLKLRNFRYQISHISGEDNVWGDLLSRWGATEREDGTRLLRTSLKALLIAPVAPELDADLSWPSHRDILMAQKAAMKRGKETPPNAQGVHGLRLMKPGVIWIPSDAAHLQLRLCVVAHCGRAGHRGFDPTMANLLAAYSWTTIQQDVRSFCSTCLHCLSTLGGQRIPRPLAHTAHAEHPNELLHFDFLWMGRSSCKMEYLLLLKDDASGFVKLDVHDAATADATVQSLLNWFSLFGVVLKWASDQGTHFRNQVMHKLNRALHAQHHFTTAGMPHANGTIERVCREVLRAVRALLSEFRMQPEDWPLMVPLVQSVLNHSKRSTHGLAPITLMTQLPADNPILSLVKPESQEVLSLELVRARQLMHVDTLHQALEDMHRDVAAARSRAQQSATNSHNAKTNVRTVNFDVGDFVLVAEEKKRRGDKLRLKWRGPRRIVAAHADTVFDIECPLNKKIHRVHANRLKFYADSQLNMTEELLDTINSNDAPLYVVDKLLDLRQDPDTLTFEVLVSWLNYASADNTWEPLANVQEDIPVRLQKFLTSFTNRDLAVAAQDSLQ
jgi:RNase H-like domain found in reverse transcriptase/Integrase zinc binding domain/Chromo (CHRromatin Organisation MOdifier) domain